MKKAIVQVSLRVERSELEKFDKCCDEHHLNRTEGLRTSLRFFMYNPDLIMGIVKLDNNIDDPGTQVILEKVSTLSQDMEDVKKGITHLAEGNKLTPFITKNRMKDLMLDVLRQNGEMETTCDKLKDQMLQREPALREFIIQDSEAFSLFDQVLLELQQEQKLTYSIDGRITFLGVNKD
jgi:hypothetical protein